jgi:2,4-dienoyl-CoA reductase-like NADH-dependent reductase (Old Yellow Enzyme family)
MCQYQARDGVAQAWHQTHIGSLAMGGAGLIIMEATAVRADGRITPYCLGLWDQAQVAAVSSIVKFANQQGARMGVQLAHAGRKGSSARPWLGGAHLKAEEGGWDTIAPSHNAFDSDGTRLWKTPRAMTQDDINDIQQCFADAAQRALQAGFEFIEIHGAHGYLLHSFLSPLVNQRNDQYGGKLENRARMLMETVAKVRQVWPEDLPLGVRLSMTDWVEGGLTLDDTIQVSAWLKAAGVDIVDCSTGGATPESRGSINGGIAQQPAMAGKARRQTGIMTMAVGEITAAQQAQDIINQEEADMVLLARQLLRDPYWPRHAAKELGADVPALMPDLHKLFIGKNP